MGSDFWSVTGFRTYEVEYKDENEIIHVTQVKIAFIEIYTYYDEVISQDSYDLEVENINMESQEVVFEEDLKKKVNEELRSEILRL